MALSELAGTWMLNKTYGLMRGFVLTAVFPVCIYIFNFLHSVAVLWEIYELRSSCFMGNVILLPLVQKHIKKPKFHARCIVPISFQALYFKTLRHFRSFPAKSFFSDTDTKYHFTMACSICKELDDWVHALYALKRKAVKRLARKNTACQRKNIFALKLYF